MSFLRCNDPRVLFKPKDRSPVDFGSRYWFKVSGEDEVEDVFVHDSGVPPSVRHPLLSILGLVMGIVSIMRLEFMTIAHLFALTLQLPHPHRRWIIQHVG